MDERFKCKGPRQSRKIVGRVFDNRAMAVRASDRMRHKLLCYLLYTKRYRLLTKKSGETLEGGLSNVAPLMFPAKRFLDGW